MNRQDVVNIPKKYQLQLTSSGNVDARPLPSKWMLINDKFSLHSPKVRKALKNPKLYIYEALLDFTKSKYGYQPKKSLIIHQDQLKKLEEIISKTYFKKSQAEKQILRERRAKNREAKKSLKQRRQKLLDKCSEEQKQLYTSNKYGLILLEKLVKPEEAHPDWLTDAIDTLAYSLKHSGIMAAWKYDNEITGADDFYECLKKAIVAYRRHNYTSYDYIDKRNMSDDEINELRRNANTGPLEDDL